MSSGSQTNMLRWRQGATLTAAAGAGEQNDPLIGFTQFDLDREIKHIEAATIERCAQIVESYDGMPVSYIAAAIRALKDKL